jgi:ABC-type transport system involved in cytochrome bd biosynthesis fused ATPase/permease subunit
MKLSHMIGAMLVAMALSFAGGSAYESQKRDAFEATVSKAESGLRDTLTTRATGWQQNTVEQMQRTAQQQQRAEACEAKFAVGTVLFEPRALASGTFLQGALSLNVGNGMQMAPAWFLPVQIEAHSVIPGAQYRWIDNRTGEIKGTFQAIVDNPVNRAQ